MEKKINIYQIDAFTSNPFEGNPAGVTFADGLSGNEMQMIAKEMNLSETAFIAKSGNAGYNLKWFTPAVEVQLCGHATIASLHFLKEMNLLKDNSSVTFDTLSGIIKCRREGERYFMQIPLYSVQHYNKKHFQILDALGLNEKQTDKNVPFIRVQNGYLFIYLKKLSSIEKIKPDFNKLLQLSKGGEADCFTVFTLETLEAGNNAHLRFFAPYYGINEDPVTGSANGPLLLVLKKLGMITPDKDGNMTANFEQGDFIGRPGRIGVQYLAKDNELYISGTAVTVMNGELRFHTKDS
ncbi:MAG TPA: PhzF family phenazine biosynthesis protein [Ignavibacteriaceae bacterium]|nr:PhzF family phenazine biosynthesis protein [Ignavibacteriaceae bacterium]